MPCYSYVLYRQLSSLPESEGYFHAHWRQEAVLTGVQDYTALSAKGRGKFVGWNVTVRKPGTNGYPVDMNERFFVDGEAQASVEFQGIEDSFGFSWGFPESENIFPLTGYWPFMQGAMAYRWFIEDAISFERSLTVAIGYGANEHPMFREQFSKPGTELQFSSTCYWYQTEPHEAFPSMLPPADRAPAPDDMFWLHKESLPDSKELEERGVQLHMRCGRPDQEVILAAPGFSAVARQGNAWTSWAPPIYHCRADNHQVQIDLSVPAGSTGKLRIYVIDPDNFEGGRRQQIVVDDRETIDVEGFQQGRWIEVPVTGDMTADQTVVLSARNLNQRSNAVISLVEWVRN